MSPHVIDNSVWCTRGAKNLSDRRHQENSSGQDDGRTASDPEDPEKALRPEFGDQVWGGCYGAFLDHGAGSVECSFFGAATESHLAAFCSDSTSTSGSVIGTDPSISVEVFQS